jgi:predicted HAD superfamily Cof-like phosphohydrolase
MNELQSTKEWFEAAVPAPDDKNRMVQLGVHIEEVSEMFDAMGAAEVAKPLFNLASTFKSGTSPEGPITFDQLTVDRKEMLDALCDQIVTAIGCAHMLGMDITQAMQRINESNWSKFVDGKPVFDENGKIKKGPDYVKPNLEGLY